MAVAVGWVKPPKYKKGLDPLGVQQPCIAVYSELLPGITNVTDRVAYFSFGPWFSWAFSNRYPNGSASQFVQMLRRAEVLFTLIGIRHGLDSDDGHFEEHGGSLVGVNILRKIVEQTPGNRSLTLSDYSVLEETALRYFKNRRGGLGQYYLGALRDEYHLLDDPKGGVIDFTLERGRPMAESLDSGVDRSHFFKCIEDDQVTLRSLDKLAMFCPCQVRSKERSTERNLLRCTVLGDLPELSENAQARRSSLALILDFLTAAEGCEASFTSADEFLTSCYARVLPNTRLWSPPVPLLPAANLWSYYVSNEMLSVAMQRLFREALRAIERESPLVQTVEAAAEWCAAYGPFSDALQELGSRTFDEFVSDTKAKLPKLRDLSNERHEVALWDSALQDPDIICDGITSAAKLVATLLVRPGSLAGNSARVSGAPSLRLEHYPINVESVFARASDVWPGMSLTNWMSSTLCWIMTTHRQVAFRKLAQSGDDTRRLRMGDSGIYFDGDIIDVARTQPRLNQAFRFLHDLGLIARAREGRLPRPTSDGRAYLRSVVDAR